MTLPNVVRQHLTRLILSASHMKGYIITTEVLPFKAAEAK